MKCKHAKDYSCPTCKPELWNPSQEWSDNWNINFWTQRVSNLISWKKAYYDGNPAVEDHVYDKIEGWLKEEFPEHPFLNMVGYDEEMASVCIEYTRNQVKSRLCKKD